MSVLLCEGVQLGVEQAGEGHPLILVHGSWSDRNTWEPVFHALATRFLVVRYDRRGYGESQRLGAEPRVHVEDLLALIRTMGFKRAILVGNSLGALIAIQAALRARPLVGLVIAHEPPMLGQLEVDSPPHPLATRVHTALTRSLQAVRAGDHRLAAQIYVEGMASYPGTWQHLPKEIQQGFIDNAPAFLTDASALQDIDLSPQELKRLDHSIVITRGARTSPYLKLVVERLYAALPELRRHVFDNGGHVPHQSCPEEFVAKTLEFAAMTANG